jgi:4a-hydroxytetrahydrobiopterin dehydratase
VSEEGWKQFLTADPPDWVVLHGGATAVFTTGSAAASIRLAGDIAALPCWLEGSGTVLTVVDDMLTVRLTRDMWQLESEHVDMARAVSAVAAEHGAIPVPSAVQEVQLAIAAKPDQIDVAFWRAVLGYSAIAEDNAVDPLGHGSTVWMQPLDEAKPLRHAMHVDVSVAREHAEERVASALAAGGTIVVQGRTTGRSRIAAATGYVWPHGRMARSSPDGALPVEL